MNNDTTRIDQPASCADAERRTLAEQERSQTTNTSEEERWGQAGLHGSDCDPWYIRHADGRLSVRLNGSYTPEQLRKLADEAEKISR